MLKNGDVQGLTIFNNQFLYTAYADVTTFFLSNENSVTGVAQIFEHFLIFSGLKQNKSKCKIAGTGVLKGVQWRSVVYNVLTQKIIQLRH